MNAVDAAVVEHRQTLDTERQRWFSAHTTWGEFWIQVIDASMPDPAGTALKMSIALGSVESLCCAIENWLGVSLDLKSATVPQAKNNFSVHVADTQNPNLPSVLLALPASAWGRIRALLSADGTYGESADNVRFTWQPVATNMVVSTVNLADSDVDKIENGAMIILPESFADVWQSTLSIFANTVTIQGRFDPLKAQWLTSADDTHAELPGTTRGAVTASPQSNPGWSVVTVQCRAELDFDPAHHFTANPTGSISLPEMLSSTAFDIYVNEQFTASGHLGVIGSGYAVFVSGATC